MRIEDDPAFERVTVREFNQDAMLNSSDDAREIELTEGTAMSFGAGVEALGNESGKVLYQWQIEEPLAEGFSDITAGDRRFTGRDTAKLIIPNVTADIDGATLRCLVARVGATMRSATRAVTLKVKAAVEGGEITAVQESYQDMSRRLQEEQRIGRLRNYGK